MNERTFPILPQCGQRFSTARNRRARGFSLVEVMIAMIVIGTSAMAALSGMMFTYRASDANLRALAALANARSVAEKILTLDTARLAGETLPVDIPSIDTGALTVNAWNDRTDDLHGTPADTADDLVMSLRPEVTQPNAATGFMCSQVIIRFRWTENSFFAPRIREDALTVVVSNIPAH